VNGVEIRREAGREVNQRGWGIIEGSGPMGRMGQGTGSGRPMLLAEEWTAD